MKEQILSFEKPDLQTRLGKKADKYLAERRRLSPGSRGRIKPSWAAVLTLCSFGVAGVAQAMVEQVKAGLAATASKDKQDHPRHKATFIPREIALSHQSISDDRPAIKADIRREKAGIANERDTGSIVASSKQWAVSNKKEEALGSGWIDPHQETQIVTERLPQEESEEDIEWRKRQSETMELALNLTHIRWLSGETPENMVVNKFDSDFMYWFIKNNSSLAKRVGDGDFDLDSLSDVLKAESAEYERVTQYGDGINTEKLDRETALLFLKIRDGSIWVDHELSDPKKIEQWQKLLDDSGGAEEAAFTFEKMVLIERLKSLRWVRGHGKEYLYPARLDASFARWLVENDRDAANKLLSLGVRGGHDAVIHEARKRYNGGPDDHQEPMLDSKTAEIFWLSVESVE